VLAGRIWIYYICFQLTHLFALLFALTVPANTRDEKERFVSSIIQALDENSLQSSTAFSRALLFRAELHREAKSNEDAIRDCDRALNSLLNERTMTTTTAVTALKSRAYRILADVYEGIGQIVEACRALTDLAACNPAMRTKIANELKRLQDRDLAQTL
jgi:hypothetical protein